MKVGDILDLKIESTGMDGEGVARKDGMVIFIPYTLVGELVKCKICFLKRDFARAKVIKVLEKSDKRITPICKQFFKCGGCSMMNLAESEYDKVKIENLKNCLRKIAKSDCEIAPLVKVGSSLGYRNKIQLPIGNVNGEIVVGYYEEKSHKITPFEKCYLHEEWADDIIKIFLQYANCNRLSVYNESCGKGLLRHLVLRKINGTASIVVVINGKVLPNYKDLVERLRGIDFNLHINVNTKDTNVIASDDYRLLSGSEHIKGLINGVKIQLSPASFMQINTAVAEKIYASVCRRLEAIGNAVVVEGYSGIGVLSNMLARHCKGVISVEIVKSAVSDAEKIILDNGNSDKIIALCGDAALLIPKIAEAFKTRSADVLESDFAFSGENCKRLQSFISGGNTAVAVIDPPRKGCDGAVLDALLAAEPQFIYYISCNPSTLARDIAILSDKYEVVGITPYDMFPMTSSIETFAELKRREYGKN